MAYKFSSLLLVQVFLVSILLAIDWEAVAKRDISAGNPKHDDQMKQPEFLKHDRGVLIPGLGRVLLPPLKHHKPHTGGIGTDIDGHTGGTGGTSGTGGPGRNHQIPGGDDTFVPNPGFEVPIPGQGAGVAGTQPHP